MGKKIIIKGADFSENGLAVPVTTWYVTLGSIPVGARSENPAYMNSSAWTFNDTYNSYVRGKTINRFRFIASSAGKFYFFVLDSRTQSLGEPAASVIVTSDKVGVLEEYELSNDVYVGENQYLAFTSPSQSASFYYARNAVGHYFFKRCGFSDATTVNGFQLMFDVGYHGLVSE